MAKYLLVSLLTGLLLMAYGCTSEYEASDSRYEDEVLTTADRGPGSEGVFPEDEDVVYGEPEFEYGGDLPINEDELGQEEGVEVYDDGLQFQREDEQFDIEEEVSRTEEELLEAYGEAEVEDEEYLDIETEEMDINEESEDLDIYDFEGTL